MRIQHNIAAMNSYRNYTNNVSAVNKNLEKLSSGYKINRAGDDAAGLAISEKMRAQISGLNAASKNAKDGVSLVKTAEGALTEVHDMLNRMVTLASQSANGTYDNEVDRANLQKEVDQLRSEIDRIADSANFNGIKLLDGSLDAGVDTVSLSGATNAIDTVINDGQLAGKTPTAGKYSVDFSQATITASELGEGTAIFKLAEDQGAIATLKIGKGESLSGADLAEAIKEGLEKSTAFKNGALEMIDADGNKTKFNLSVDGSKLVLEMTEPPKVAFDTKLDAAFEAVDATVTLSVTGEQIQVTPEVEAVPEVGRAYGQASFTLTADKIKDGAAVKIGNETYIFCVGENSKYKGLKNAIDMTDAEGDIALAAQRLAQAAKDNESFYVGANLNDGVVTVTEKEGAVDYSKNNLAGTDGKSEVNGSGGDQDADDNGALDLVAHEDGDDQQADEGEDAILVAGEVEGRHAGAEGDQLHVQQADEGDEQANAGGDGALEEGGDGGDDLAAQGAHGDNQEQDAAEQHDGQGLLPGVAHAQADRVGEEGVEAHAGGLGEGGVGQQGREHAADGGGGGAGGHQHGHPQLAGHGGVEGRIVGAGVQVDAEHVGVDEDDVGHGKERGDAAYDLGADAAAPLGDLKEFVHVSPPLYKNTHRSGVAPVLHGPILHHFVQKEKPQHKIRKIFVQANNFSGETLANFSLYSHIP